MLLSLVPHECCYNSCSAALTQSHTHPLWHFAYSYCSTADNSCSSTCCMHSILLGAVYSLMSLLVVAVVVVCSQCCSVFSDAFACVVVCLCCAIVLIVVHSFVGLRSFWFSNCICVRAFVYLCVSLSLNLSVCIFASIDYHWVSSLLCR